MRPVTQGPNSLLRSPVEQPYVGELGRGSAAGSIVACVLGITGLAPIPHGLIFEPSSTPEHFSMPEVDIDFDFGERRRLQTHQQVNPRRGQAPG